MPIVQASVPDACSGACRLFATSLSDGHTILRFGGRCLKPDEAGACGGVGGELQDGACLRNPELRLDVVLDELGLASGRSAGHLQLSLSSALGKTGDLILS